MDCSKSCSTEGRDQGTIRTQAPAHTAVQATAALGMGTPITPTSHAIFQVTPMVSTRLLCPNSDEALCTAGVLLQAPPPAAHSHARVQRVEIPDPSRRAQEKEGLLLGAGGRVSIRQAVHLKLKKWICNSGSVADLIT